MELLKQERNFRSTNPRREMQPRMRAILFNDLTRIRSNKDGLSTHVPHPATRHFLGATHLHNPTCTMHPLSCRRERCPISAIQMPPPPLPPRRATPILQRKGGIRMKRTPLVQGPQQPHFTTFRPPPPSPKKSVGIQMEPEVIIIPDEEEEEEMKRPNSTSTSEESLPPPPPPLPEIIGTAEVEPTHKEVKVVKSPVCILI